MARVSYIRENAECDLAADADTGRELSSLTQAFQAMADGFFLGCLVIRRSRHTPCREFCAAVLISIVLAMSLAIYALPAHGSPASSPPVTVGGPFTLTASDGTVVTDQTYAGKWLLVYFGFTSCPNTCPTALLEITATLKALGFDADKLQPLFITVDPRRDTPAVMEKYTQSFDPAIIGLTGTEEQIAAVAKEYGAYYAAHRTGPGPDDYVFDHSTYFYLMDPQGKFARGFDTDTPGEDIAEAIRELMARSADRTNHAGLMNPTSK
jgi:protein SCO1